MSTDPGSQLNSLQDEEEVDTYLYGSEFTSTLREERERAKNLQQQRVEEEKLGLGVTETISATSDDDDIYDELGPSKEGGKPKDVRRAQDTSKTMADSRKLMSDHEGEGEQVEEEQSDANDDDDDEDIEIILNMPTKEELEAKRQQSLMNPSGANPLNLRTNKTYVKPGLESGRIEKSLAPITSTQDINLETVGQIQGRDAYEFDVDSLEDKPWKKPGADLTDYFNYGFNEHTWKQYCQKQLSLRAEFGLKKRINVYESDMDMRDLPLELQVLASDQQENFPEKARDYHRSGRIPSGPGTGRFGGRRGGGGNGGYARDDSIDTIIQIPTTNERRPSQQQQPHDYSRPLQVFGGDDEGPLPLHHHHPVPGTHLSDSRRQDRMDYSQGRGGGSRSRMSRGRSHGRQPQRSPTSFEPRHYGEEMNHPSAEWEIPRQTPIPQRDVPIIPHLESRHREMPVPRPHHDQDQDRYRHKRSRSPSRDREESRNRRRR